MNGFDVFIETLRAQAGLYRALLDQAERMNAALEEGAGTDDLLSIMAERDGTVDRIKENDALIARTLSEPGRSGWLEKGEAARMVEETREIIKRIMERDEKGRALLEKAKRGVQENLGESGRTRRGAAGYGGLSREIFGRYKDLKL